MTQNIAIRKYCRFPTRVENGGRPEVQGEGAGGEREERGRSDDDDDDDDDDKEEEEEQQQHNLLLLLLLLQEIWVGRRRTRSRLMMKDERPRGNHEAPSII